MQFVDVGFSNFVEANKIISISRPDSSPIRRIVSKAKEEGKYVDLTQGKKTRSVIIATSNPDIVVLGSAVQSNTIITRLRKVQGEAASAPSRDLVIIGEGSSE